MKKITIFQVLLLIIFASFIIFLFKSKNYHQEYKINDINVKESYNKKTKSYYFEFLYKNINIDYLIETKYQTKRKLISDIEVIEDRNNFCLNIKSDFIIKPLCSENGEIIHYSLVNDNLKAKLSKSLFSESNQISEYQGIKIFNNNYNYLIWNYNGFYYLNKNENKKIELLNKEIYKVNLIEYTKDYLIIADYNNEYTFNKFYIIDFKNGNKKTIDINYDIYFDSYFPGYNKNKAYIIDNKEARMYELDAKKGKFTKTKSKILKKGTWENVSIKSLINKKTKFEYSSNYIYELKENTLTLKYQNKNIKHKIAEDVTSIIKIANQDIFYLKKDSLYHFNETTGEELLLKCFEWNFNYENIIYIN